MESVNNVLFKKLESEGVTAAGHADDIIIIAGGKFTETL